MNNHHTIGMKDEASNRTIPLNSVNADIKFVDTFCNTTLTQVYQNCENREIEAVYTFPLSSRAVIMDLKVKVGQGEWLKSVVVEEIEAVSDYEEAISKGNSAIRLEEVESGLYTMNIGRIMPHEKVLVKISYAELYEWQGESFRFHLPTTIAPRYGDPEAAGLDAFQVPEYGPVENHLFLNMEIRGLLSKAQIQCPSHNVNINRKDSRTIISFSSEKALMDRDFVLEFKMHAEKRTSIF